jgi:hypothetical protein
MGADRRGAIIDAERFAAEARIAASEGDHMQAAVLYWAAAMVLDGHSVAEIEFLLAQFSSLASTLLRSGILRPENALSPAATD